MGRRSINTTKSGKYMNPTDQARKEARKRELKKNKKQRMAVRAAVLKNKDPLGLLQDLEALDELELNPEVKTDLNEKVIKEKRKKIKETFERVLKLYSREEPERYNEFKKAEKKYEKQRAAKVKDYEAIRDARQVAVDSIPLPDDMGGVAAIPLPEDIPLPGAQPPSILKKTSSYGPPVIPPAFLPPVLPPPLPTLTWPYCLPNGKKPPGPPPGLPPGVTVAPPGPPMGLPPHLAAAHQMEQLLRDEEDARHSSDEEDIDMLDEPSREREQDDNSDEMETDDSEDEDRRRRNRNRDLDDSDSDSDTDDSMRDEKEEEERRERRRKRQEERRERRLRRGSDEDDNYRRRRDRSQSSSDEDDMPREREKRSVRFADDDADTSEQNLSRQLPAGMTPLQARMLAMAGQQIPMSAPREEDDGDDYDEDEEEKREKEEEKLKEEKRREESIVDAQLAALRQMAATAQGAKGDPATSTAQSLPAAVSLPQSGPPARLPPGPPPSAPPGFPPGMQLPPNFPRPPPLRPPPPPLRMIPPGPPGGRPPAPPPGLPPNVPPMMRGGPPPRLNLPPGLLPPPRLPMPPLRPGMPRLENPNVFTAAPMIRRLPTKAEEAAEVKSGATIEAKPQIRNLAADVTRFMPTSLRVKRDAKGKTKGLKAGVEETSIAPAMKPSPAVQSATKDDAYDQFMKEMGDLM